MTYTTAKSKLHTLSTTDLIAAYDEAINSYSGRYTDTSPRQRRINYIVDLLVERGDDNDSVAAAWFGW